MRNNIIRSLRAEFWSISLIQFIGLALVGITFITITSIYSPITDKQIRQIRKLKREQNTQFEQIKVGEDEVNTLKQQVDIIDSTISSIPDSVGSAARVPLTGIVSSGLLYYELGTCQNIKGNICPNLTISPSSPSGDEVVSSVEIFAVLAKFCLQYSTQGGSDRRTFTTLEFNRSSVSSCATGVPRNSNNWRETAYAYSFGLQPFTSVRVTSSSNAFGVISLNSGEILFLA